MKNVSFCGASIGMGVVIKPPEGLEEFEEQCQALGDEELLEKVNHHLRSSLNLCADSPLPETPGAERV